MKSEFGKGLVICLVKFAEHQERTPMNELKVIQKWMDQTEENKKLMLSDNPPDGLNYGKPYMDYLKYFQKTVEIYGTPERAMTSQIKSIMNAASDHLYEIEVPKGWTTIEKRVKKLQEKGLEMGHGFLSDKEYVIGDIYWCFTEARNIALMIDRKIGLKPDEGEW